MLVVGSLVAKSCLTLVTRGLSPARLLCPWDSPGKNTGVGCYFLFLGKMLVGDKTTFKYICRNWPFLPMNFKVKESIRWSVVSNSLQPHGLWPARLLCPWNSPGKNTRVGWHFLLQGIFLTQGWNPGLPLCRQILYHLSHPGSPTANFLKEAFQEMISSLCKIWNWWECKICLNHL